MTDKVSADVLIIDDDELVRATMRDVLEEAGYSVAEAKDGDAGLDEIMKFRPRAVICDVRMPGKNGYEVLKEVRLSHPEVAHIPFIFLSALSDKEYVAAGFKIGADDYVTKPVDPDLLRMKVDATLRQVARLTAARAPSAPTPGPGSGESTQAARPTANEAGDQRKAIRQEIARAEGKGPLMSGSVQLVSLEEFRDKFGDEWERLRDKALAIAESIIRKRLKPRDLCTRYDNDGFLILYQSVDKAEAKRRVTALADELRVRLLGEDYSSYSQLEVSAISFDLTDFLDENGEVDFGLLAETHEKVRHQTEDQEKTADAPPTWFKDQLSVQYMPVWSSVREAVAAFQCVPVRTTPYGELWGQHVLHGGATDPWAILVDEFLIQAIAPYFDASSPYSDVAALCLPVHFHSLSEENIEILDRAIAALSPELVRNKLIIQIIGLPEFRGSANVQRAIHWAKGHSQHVAIEIPPDDRHTSIARSAGADILYLRVPSSDDEERRRKQLKQIEEQGSHVKRLGLRAIIENVNLLDQFAVSVKGGFTFISGKAIGPPVEGPRPPYSLSVAKVIG